MLFLRTGLPGAGKTLNTIKDLDEEHQADPDNPNLRLHKDPDHPDLPPRTIYYHGIPELKVDKLKAKWVEWDDPEHWFDLPDGSVIVIDEAQGTFGTDVRTRVPKVTRFEKHRHQGLDIHLITQHPSLVCLPVRKLVGKHINFIRPYGKTKGVFRHEYEMCVDSPEKRVNFKMSQETKIEFDPHYFSLYKSSTVHTHKKVKPTYLKGLWIGGSIFAGCILLIIVGGYFMLQKYRDRQHTDEQAKAQAVDEAPVPDPHALRPAGKPILKSSDGYVEDYKPRIADVPGSAPRYDQLTKPKDFPRPTCLASTDIRLVSTAKERGLNVGTHNGQQVTCQCYTQQMSRMSTSLEFCMDVVQNGYFDDSQLQRTIATSDKRGPTMVPSGQADGLRRGLAAVDQRPQTASRTQSQHAFNEPVIVADSEMASRPWRNK